MSEQQKNQSLAGIEPLIDSPAIYSSEELSNYADTLQETINEYELQSVEKDNAYYQAVQRLEMTRRGWMLVGLESKKAQEQLHKLFSEFGTGFAGVSREEEFDVANETTEESIELLKRLPFVGEEDIVGSSGDDRFEIDGKIEVPLNAVIGAASLENWAGRRASHLKNGRSSIDVIREYASRGKYDGSSGLLDAIEVRGPDGRSYLYLTSSHRAAAAKLRGDKSIIVDSITLKSDPSRFELS
jgi:hypothetical protein